MIRYGFLLIIYIAFYILSMFIAPVLPLFSNERIGPVNSSGGTEIEPRLPTWLAWFDTSQDNSLWGDEGWRVKHCPTYWNTCLGMVLWLWRNPACGFIRSSGGSLSLRWCKKVGRKVLSFEAGWLLDVYLKDYAARQRYPRAPFQFQPQIKTAKV